MPDNYPQSLIYLPPIVLFKLVKEAVIFTSTISQISVLTQMCGENGLAAQDNDLTRSTNLKSHSIQNVLKDVLKTLGLLL